MKLCQDLDRALWIVGGAVLCLIVLTTAALSASFGWINWSPALLWAGTLIWLGVILLLGSLALSDLHP